MLHKFHVMFTFLGTYYLCDCTVCAKTRQYMHVYVCAIVYMCVLCMYRFQYHILFNLTELESGNFFMLQNITYQKLSQ